MKIQSIGFKKVCLKQNSSPIGDVYEAGRTALSALGEKVASGMRIAVAVGSRGINQIDVVTKAVIDQLRMYGAEPFIVPAMGSHGGATSEGQAQVLAGYGIDEERMGVPVLSSMDTEIIGKVTDPFTMDVFMDKNAYQADGVIVINRVKAHTDFHADHESGIVKMLVIGLGKQDQALAVHHFGTDGLRRMIPAAAEVVLNSGKILGGVAILEDGHDKVCHIEGVLPEDFMRRDGELLLQSKKMMAKLPFDKLDVLIISQMGKDISGTGMDPNVIGRVRIQGEVDAEPCCSRIVTLELTENSHGNALGVGLADLISRRLAEQIDWKATQENVITSGFLERGFCPVVMETDLEAVQTALDTCCAADPERIRIAWIRNTLELGEVWITEPLVRDEMEILASDLYLPFDKQGILRLEEF